MKYSRAVDIHCSATIHRQVSREKIMNVWFGQTWQTCGSLYLRRRWYHLLFPISSGWRVARTSGTCCSVIGRCWLVSGTTVASKMTITATWKWSTQVVAWSWWGHGNMSYKMSQIITNSRRFVSFHKVKDRAHLTQRLLVRQPSQNHSEACTVTSSSHLSSNYKCNEPRLPFLPSQRWYSYQNQNILLRTLVRMYNLKYSRNRQKLKLNYST